MQIMLGYSGEQSDSSWRKVEVSLDETDLGRLFIEMDLPPGTLGEILTTEAFGLLEAEGQRLLMAELITRFPNRFKTDENLELLRGYMESRDRIVSKIRER